jgi:hypothetical protein
MLRRNNMAMHAKKKAKGMARGGAKMKSKGYARGGMKSKGMSRGGSKKTMTLAQIRSMAKAKGYKLVKV